MWTHVDVHLPSFGFLRVTFDFFKTPKLNKPDNFRMKQGTTPESAGIVTLESRVADLEQQLLGCEGATADREKLIDDLVSINQKVNEAVAGRENFKKTFQELSKIKELLDPKFTDSVGHHFVIDIE